MAKEQPRRGGERVGKLPPRYRFTLNPFPGTRFSTCVGCRRLTYPRKFPLFIHIEGWGPMTLGKTCKYCPRCEWIYCHQDELEAQLYHSFAQRDPAVLGSDYFVIGVVETKVWKKGLGETPLTLEETFAHMSDIKKYMDVDIDPGGWRHESDTAPRYLPRKPPDTPWRRAAVDRGPRSPPV